MNTSPNLEQERQNRNIPYFPIALNIQNQPVLVVGGGKVAEQKVRILLESQAKITIVSPDLTPELIELNIQNQIVWRQRKILLEDVRGIVLVIAATNDPIANQNIFQWATRQNILVNVVDQVPLSNFISPALFRQEGTIVTVYTDGKSPSLSRDLKNFIKTHWQEFLEYRESVKIK